ncbi:MAG TPA: 16S rRNA (guanine(966)-N(2))-methyltransferase RsmD [Ideonella sp.]|nr:16S rRNA (guanine(966)-N(2))-methyltransferase RsmD [Ideonella sp.]
MSRGKVLGLHGAPTATARKAGLDASGKLPARGADKVADKPAAPRPAHVPAHARHEVRIVGGQWRRSVLPVANKPGLRPTPDRVRETLFNWLGQDLSGWRVLDAFAGSGALGFEAASRGAAQVVLLEQDADLVKSLSASRERLKAVGMRVQRADGLGWMRGAPPASLELILLDPPFDAGLALPAVHAAARLLVPGGFIYLESAEPAPAELPPGLQLYRQGRAGAVHFALLRAAEPGEGAAGSVAG